MSPIASRNGHFPAEACRESNSCGQARSFRGRCVVGTKEQEIPENSYATGSIYVKFWNRKQTNTEVGRPSGTKGPGQIQNAGALSPDVAHRDDRLILYVRAHPYIRADDREEMTGSSCICGLILEHMLTSRMNRDQLSRTIEILVRHTQHSELS